MSGDKDSYVDLNAPDKDRLMESCQRLDDVQVHISRRLNRMAQNFREVMDRCLQRLQQHTVDSEQMLTGAANFDADVQQMCDTADIRQYVPMMQQATERLIQVTQQQVQANEVQREQLQTAQTELVRQTWQQVVHYAVAALDAACEAQKTAEFAFETEGGTVPLTADIDYWTQGGLSSLRERVQFKRQQLALIDHFSANDLQRFVNDLAEEQNALDILIERARESIIASQLRNNIGQTIELALLSAGWELVDATYTGEDYRQAVHLKLRNLSGDEIVTIITPDLAPHEGIRNRLQVSFFDRTTNDETSRMQRLNHIFSILQENGLECGEPECVPGTEDGSSRATERLNFHQVRQERPVMRTVRR